MLRRRSGLPTRADGKTPHPLILLRATAHDVLREGFGWVAGGRELYSVYPEVTDFMKTIALAVLGLALLAVAPPGPDPNSQYRLGPDSMPQEGVSKGEIRGPYHLPSQAYPGTQHTYWVYVPAQYDPANATALMVYQDGQAFRDENGDIRAQNVMDNLIYRREIPVMLAVFIDRKSTRL